MPHFKDANNKLFWLDDGDDPAVWLPQCTPISEQEVNAIRQAEAQAALDAMTYADKRRAAYPSIPDQLDTLYHGGYDAWKATIQAVKDKYPKE